MLDILKVHLEQTETPDYINMIEEAHSLFTKFNLPDFEFEFTELLQCFDEHESPSEEIYYLTLQNQLTIIRLHGMELDSESILCKIPLLSKILTAILLIGDFEGADEIDNIVTNTTDQKETMGLIFNAVDPSIQVEDVMSLITEMVHVLPTRILEVVSKNRDKRVANEEERVTQEYQQFVQNVVDVVGPTHVHAAARLYHRILPFEDYTPIIEELFPEDIAKLNIPALANELIVAAVISNAGQGNYLMVVKKYMEDLTELTMEQHTQLLVAVEQLITKIGTFRK